MNSYDVKFLVDKLYKDLDQKLISNQKIVLEKPNITNINKKTFFINFKSICQKLNRKEEDLRIFFEKELNTEVNVNQEGNLIIVGIFKTTAIITIISNFIKDFCTCKECNCCDTELIKEKRLTFIFCKKCLSKKSIS